MPRTANTARAPGQSKFRARRTEVDGLRFDSKKEATHWVKLKAAEAAGEIEALERQVRLPLIVNGTRVGGSIIDFRFIDRTSDPPRTRLQDVKGFIGPKHPNTQLWKLKHKLIEATYGVNVEIVR